MNQHTLSKPDYESFRAFLEDACGIVLGENKHYLVTSRLSRLLDEFNFSSLSGMIDKLKQVNNTDLKGKIIDAMTTNETSWFRDKYPFEILHDELFNEIAKNEGSEQHKQPLEKILPTSISDGQWNKQLCIIAWICVKNNKNYTYYIDYISNIPGFYSKDRAKKAEVIWRSYNK